MPKRKDIRKILVIGSGPIVIGQAAEFDYAGTQACLALREEGYEVVLANSNPATIMTDTTVADKVYMEPLTAEYVARIIRYERPDAIVPGIGGQTGLNLAVELQRLGVLAECRVEVLGTKVESIELAEDREKFKELCESLGEPVLPSETAETIEGCVRAAEGIGYPVVLRPAFTLGGTGGGFADDEAELRELAKHALAVSPVHQVLVREEHTRLQGDRVRGHARRGRHRDSRLQHGEHRPRRHPHRRLHRRRAQPDAHEPRVPDACRDSALKIIRALGVEGGCNVQFALDPDSFQYFLIEVNPRVSRSSASRQQGHGLPDCARQRQDCRGVSPG